MKPPDQEPRNIQKAIMELQNQKYALRTAKSAFSTEKTPSYVDWIAHETVLFRLGEWDTEPDPSRPCPPMDGKDAFQSVCRFFEAPDWPQYAQYVCRKDHEYAVLAYLSGRPLEKIALFRLARCEGILENTALEGLIDLSLDRWIVSWKDETVPHNDVEAYIHAIHKVLIADQPHVASGLAHISVLRRYLNRMSSNDAMLQAWTDVLSSCFDSNRPGFADVFLVQMLYQGKSGIRRKNRRRIGKKVRSLLCLCGYSYIRRMSGEIYRGNVTREMYKACTAVIETAIENLFFLEDDHRDQFIQVFPCYLIVEESEHIKALLLDSDQALYHLFADCHAAFQPVMVELLHRYLVEQFFPPDMTARHDILHKLSTLVLEIPEKPMAAYGDAWSEILQAARRTINTTL
ncbi:hypothetical protein LJC27_08075 [Christensenellaceae bacterium OttesenSCG-928-M15]|nr:hypothetical protein [Christensenellaceae bacterium OttesenSCG-928-M15]